MPNGATCEASRRYVPAPVALHIIDKGLPTTSLLAQVLVAKYLDHLPLFRQEAIFERTGHAISALTRYLNDGDLPIDNNWVENRIRPVALGRQNWLFAGSLRVGKRAAAVMGPVLNFVFEA